MPDVVPSRDIAVVGRSCRLPGAATVEQLWANLVAGICSVTTIPPDRWSLSRHGHPRLKEAGKSYVWSAGVLDGVWDFDPTVFGISPREAEQMDPQQRLMLELTWEALESAGMQRSRVAGTEVGVFVGASSTEYQTIRNTDLSGGDAYTATGTSLSIISNRISHAFDFRGPSLTVDTACSSSLVAMHQAMVAIHEGLIDTAVVGGVNLLLSPVGFVLFSQATMLSPTGLCRTFDADADGYVRSEGGVVLVLKSMARAQADGDRIFARVVASGANSDGRTNGIALPSRDAQTRLLRQVYARAEVAADDVVFVEAHGTGTRVGDPIEAATIGQVLGSRRQAPLKIGSIKSNIGHLEPASGLAGVLKAMLSLEHDLLPASINIGTPNPEIPFGDLGLEVATAQTPLPRGNRPRYAGVNSFGFGGANAHVVVGDPPSQAGKSKRYQGTSDLLALSAASAPALRDLARRYGERLALAGFDQTREVAAAAAHQREQMSERLVVEWESPRDLVRKLERIVDRDDSVTGVTWGTANEVDAPVAFVFSGNGGQWPGMGRGAYRTNRRFREAFDEIDALFDSGFGWSITETLFASDLKQRLRLTQTAQPLIFAIQVALTRALAAEGLEAGIVLGHSVGEIAAAAVSGALTLPDAVRVIEARSRLQELARDTGRMAVVAASRDAIEELCRDAGGIEIAAENTSRNFTVVGDKVAIRDLARLARKRRIALRELDLEYPFHSHLIDAVRKPLLTELAGLTVAVPKVPMVSTVTGQLVAGRMLDGPYWWRNIREPVRFASAVSQAAEWGARVFLEIGPRSVLLSNMADVLSGASTPCATLGVLERQTEPETRDPIRVAAISAFTRGAATKVEKLFGPEPVGPVALPTYPWQRRSFRPPESSEAIAWTLDTRWHRLAGARHTQGGLEWTNSLDVTVLPELADHEVGGQAILPAAGYIEMMLSVGREWLGRDAELVGLDIFQPLPLEAERTQEVKTRISAATSTIDVLSRPRLSRADWQLHATARIVPASEALAAAVWPETGGEPVSADAIYRASASVGLRYGPAFRLLGPTRREGRDRILVELLPSMPAGPYRIDPARLDACFHGLFALLAELGAERRGVAYIPVRFGHVSLQEGGGSLARAAIDLVRVGERALVADFTLFDGSGEVIGQLRDARFQAARVQRLAVLADKALVQDWIAADRGTVGGSGPGIDAAAMLAAAHKLSAEIPDDTADSVGGAEMLIEGWASAAAFELARRMATDGRIAGETLAALEPRVTRWLHALLRSLERSGLATEQDQDWLLAKTSGLPPCETILRTFAAEHPDRAAELLLAGRVADMAQRGWGTFEAPSVGVADGYERGGVSERHAAEFLSGLIGRTGAVGADARGVRILQLGHGTLSALLAAEVAVQDARLTILDPDPRRRERARLSIRNSHVDIAESVEALAGRMFDLILSAEGLGRFRAENDLRQLADVLGPGGCVVALEPAPSLFRDIALGLLPDWFDEAAPFGFPFGRDRSAGEWAAELAAAGLKGGVAETIQTGGASQATLIVASAPDSGAVADVVRSVSIDRAGDHGGIDADRLGKTLIAAGHHALPTDQAAAEPRGALATSVLLIGVPAQHGGGDAARLRDLCLAVKAHAEGRPDGSELWVVIDAGRGHGELGPLGDAILAFTRTLANEQPRLTLRRVTIDAGTADEAAEAALTGLLSVAQAETDLRIGPDGCRVLRLVPPGTLPSHGSAPGSRLERCAFGGLSGLAWQGGRRSVPAAGEIEIAVEATGLNFRDVMWAMSLLPDEMLEDGFAGPTLGLECAGKVASVGPGVAGFAPGDRVVAFGPAAFATSVAVPVGVAARIPDGWTAAAAASVPVAFLTAYYGLVTLGGLRAGDWVLIHGGAGGVGLAAIQVARHCGATVVATAGSPEKRALLRSLGVEHVLNSRSTAFVEELRRIRRKGVDVVLNSLSGEAMERGLGALAPFGRFIELGKRDYVANTMIGLRPFRRNLSYFGVDVDQLLSDRARVAEIFGTIMAMFEAGDLHPLPHRVFGSGETLDAFRLMQQSGHIGKIVVTPPHRAADEIGEDPVRISPERTHLVTGGFGGFGLVAARWLADRGAMHIALIGRKGPESAEAAAVVAELEARGIQVVARACDVTDRRALSRFLKEIGRTMPPVAGVLHAAMVLEDGLAETMTGDQLDRVLGPKVDGADHLDRLLDGVPLDYFVLFSSITTFIGNPGQSAYVAANGYLEGLARERRRKGKPGLAVAWGAISDVGVLTRHRGLAEALATRVGVKAMPAREALDLMAEAMAQERSGRRASVMAVGSLDWSAARRLPGLASPTFAVLMRGGSTVAAVERVSIDLAALVASKDPETVRQEVAEIVLGEIATVLRVPRQDVNPSKRLSEIGIDSLMAIELATALQDRLQLHAPPSGSVAALSGAGLADHLISAVRATHADEAARVTQALNERHAGIDLDLDALSPVLQVVREHGKTRKGLLN